MSKKLLPKGAHPRDSEGLEACLSSFADAKVRLFSKLTKHRGFFFEKTTERREYTLYIIYAREAGEAHGAQKPRTGRETGRGDRGEEGHGRKEKGHGGRMRKAGGGPGLPRVSEELTETEQAPRIQKAGGRNYESWRTGLRKQADGLWEVMELASAGSRSNYG